MTAAADDRLLDLRFPAHAGEMALVRRSVRSAARLCGFDETTTRDIVLAVGEVCQNVIRHAYAGPEKGDIVLVLLRDPDGIVVRVADFAPAIDPKTIKPRELDDVRPHGLGTHFLREIMDTADFLPPPKDPATSCR